jgi:hypothetical protein
MLNFFTYPLFTLTLEERSVIHFGEDGQFAANGGIQYLAPGSFVGFARHLVTDLGRVQVGQLPAEPFAEITRIEVVGIVAVRDNGLVGVAFAGEVVIDADQDDLREAHVEGKLECNVGDCGAFPNTTGHIIGKLWTGVSGVEENHVIREALEVTVGMPGDELGDGQRCDLPSALLDDQVIDGREIGSGKTQLGKHQVNAVHTEGVLILEFGKVGMFQAGTVADDEASLPGMNVLHLPHAIAAFTPPGMQIGIRDFWKAAEGIITAFYGLEYG